MNFQTEQIKLRPFELEDAPVLRAYLNHPKLSGRRYIPRRFPDEVPLSLNQVEAIIKKWGEEEREAHLGVEMSDKGDLIGHVEFEWRWDPQAPWMSVVIARQHQRQGYGTQAANLILEYLFEYTPAHNVSGWMADWNRVGRSFAEKLGFKESGRSRREGFREGSYFDGILVDILRPEYKVKGGFRYGAGR
jgi:RimJ/RimL family protein N-acetyltransferase